jgi:hypothetical protein
MIEVKGPKFTNKDKGYQTRFIGAGKKADGEYETEEECLARVKDMFDVEDVPCIWDEDRKGFIPMVEDEVMTQDNEKLPTTEDVEEAEDMDAQMEEEKSDDAVVQPDLTEEGDHTEDLAKPEPSEDGERSYNLDDSNGSADFQKLINTWQWESGEDSLFDKLLEEVNEAKEGSGDKLVLEGSMLKTTGISRDSEMITVGIIVFKWLAQRGLSVEQIVKTMHLRNQEQYDRYSALHNKT